MKGSHQIAVVTALTCAVAFVPSDKQSAGIVTLKNCTLIPSLREHGPRIRERPGAASNWGGYAVETSLTAPQRDAVTAVQGSWIVPTVSASTSAQTYSALWVGIDGNSDNSVEQLGTEQDWTPSGPIYYVWFEMYPHGGHIVTDFPIEPGDEFSASVEYVGHGLFVLSITNLTKGVSFTVPPKYTNMKNARRESAEWIVEAPFERRVLPLADFDTVFFSDCSATLNDVTGAIDNPHWQNDAITMASGSVVKTQPSGLEDSTVDDNTTSAFLAQWSHE